MPGLDAQAIVREGAAAAAGLCICPPSRLSRGPVGLMLGNESGTSTDFHDFREYQPGDDLRRVDWGVYARSMSLVIRQYRIEVAPVVEILLDTSASMGLYQGKSAAATFAASFLTSATRRAEGRPVLVLPSERVTGSGVEHALARVSFETRGDPDVATRWPRGEGRPLRMLVSDLLFPAAMGPYLGALAHDAASLVVVQVLSSTERTPAFKGPMRLVDAEGSDGRRDLNVSRSVLSGYARKLTAHVSGIEEATRRLGATLVRIDVADEIRDAKVLYEGIVPKLLAHGVVEAS